VFLTPVFDHLTKNVRRATPENVPTLVSSFDEPQNISKFVTFLRVLFSPLIPEEYCIAATVLVAGDTVCYLVA